MKSKTSAKVVTIYSIVLGALIMIGGISNFGDDNDRIFSIFLGITMLVLGIIGLNIANKEKRQSSEKGIVITLFVFYCIFEFFSFFTLLIPFFGVQIFLIIQVLIITPFIFSIKYLNDLSKQNDKAISRLEEIDQVDTEIKPSDFEQMIQSLKKLKEEGLLSEEEFKEHLNKYINQNF